MYVVFHLVSFTDTDKLTPYHSTRFIYILIFERDMWIIYSYISQNFCYSVHSVYEKGYGGQIWLEMTGGKEGVY